MKQTTVNLLIALLVLGHLAAGAVAHAAAAKELRGEDLMRALQSGGYTILMRHARTDRSIPNKETPGTVPALRMDQRNLTVDGERDVRLMHDVVQKYRLPIGEVVTSPSYRCRETADAFGKWTETMALRTFPVSNDASAIVSAKPKPGTNRVIITHHFIIEGLVPGITPGDIGESEAAVVRPSADGKVELVGKILLADWEQFAGVSAPAPAPAAPTSHATAHGAAVVFPGTPAGRVAAAYLEAFNSGDREQMRAFVEASLLPSPDRPTEARLQTYDGLFAEHGPIRPTAIQSSIDEKIVLNAQSKRGNLVVTVTAAPADATRAQSITIGLVQPGGGH